MGGGSKLQGKHGQVYPMLNKTISKPKLNNAQQQIKTGYYQNSSLKAVDKSISSNIWELKDPESRKKFRQRGEDF